MVSFLTILAAVLLVASPCHGEITLDPPILIFDEIVTVKTLSFTCEIPRHLTNAKIISVYMDRNGVRLGIATQDSSPELNKNIPGSSIKGNVNQSVTITMTQATCRDAGEYVCDIMYSIGRDSPKEYIVPQRLHVTVKPRRNVTMTASPHKPEYSFNETVQLSCSGLIGSKNLFFEILWIWEYMEYDQSNIWKKIADSEITNDPPIYSRNNCQNHQVSNISRTLTLEDNRRTYRCYITWKGIVYTENPPTYLFTLVGGDSYNKSNETIDPSLATSVLQPDAEVVPWWIIVAAVVGGVILFLVIGIVIFFLRRSQINADKRIRNKNEDESEGDDATSSVPTIDRVHRMKNYLHLDSVLEKESELASDRESAVDASGNAFNASSRGSVSGQGTAREVQQ